MLMGYGGQDLGSRSFRDATWVSVLRLRVSSFVFKVEAQPPELLDPELHEPCSQAASIHAKIDSNCFSQLKSTRQFILKRRARKSENYRKLRRP